MSSQNTASRPWYSKIVWLTLGYTFLSPIAAVVLTYLFLSRNGWSWPQFTFALIYGGMASFCITGGYHRLFSHRSYEASRGLKWFYLIMGAAALEMSALKWCTDHRRHHRFVDTDDDPYNIRRGFFYAHLGWLLLEDNPKYAGIFEKDLEEDKAIWFQHKYYWPLAIFMTFGVPTLAGALMGSALGGLAIGGITRVVLIQHSTYCINSFCHTFGTQPYTDQNSARDSFWAAVFAVGEGYHNFHHKFQVDYRNGVKWYQWDPTKWLVAAFSWVGWTSRLHRTPQPIILKARMEMDQKVLVERGLSVERLQPFRLKVEEAQRRLKVLKEDYETLKSGMKEKSHRRLEALRSEIKVARAEFRIAWKQWCAYRKYPRLALQAV